MLSTKFRPEQSTLFAFGSAVVVAICAGAIAATDDVFVSDLQSILTKLPRFTPRSERPTLPGFGVVILLAVCTCFFALIAAFRPSHTRSLLSAAAISFITYLCFVVDINVPFWHLYPQLTAWPGSVVEYLERVIAGHQDKDRWHRIRGESKPEDFEVPQTFWERLKWSWAIQCNSRGYGWSYEVKNIPAAPPPGTKRWPHLAKVIGWMLWYFFLKTMGSIVVAHLTAGGRYLDDGIQVEPASVFFSLPFWKRTVVCWLFVTNAFWSIEMAGSIPLVIGLAFKIWKPEECPPMNGPLTQLYTVRKAWGTVWHQMMRRIASFPGNIVAHDVLRLRKGTFGSRYVQLFVGFAVTGFVHAFSGYALLGYSIGEWHFYLGQAAAIFLEDHVVKLGKALGLKDNAFWRFCGFAWVVVWFSLSLPWWAGHMTEHGSLLSDKPLIDPLGLDSMLRRLV